MPAVVVRRTYLALRFPEQLRRAEAPAAADLRLERRRPIDVDEYRALYRAVGEPWHWRDRLAWSDERLAAWLAHEHVHVWVLSVAEEAAGYFELHRQQDGGVELVYFGLRPEYVGRRLGGLLLTRAAEEAWRLDARYVWLHTCSLDGPAALPNYLARGFVPFRTEEYVAVTGEQAKGGD